MRFVACVVAVVLASAPAPLVQAAPERTGRPNVLLLLMDDARTGQTFAMPRTLDWLRDHGREYPDAMVSTPSCCPYERDDERPWFIYAGFTAPHAPQVPEPRYANLGFPWDGNPATRETDRGDKAAYVRHFNRTQEQGAAERQAQLRTLRSVDDALESIRRRLRATGELDDTLVVLLSDNGKFWGEHGLQEKFMPYLQAERVPLLISRPGHGDRSSLLTEYWRDPANGAGIPPWASTYVPGRYRYTEIYDDAGAVTDREFYDLRSDPWQLTNVLRDGVAGNDPALAPLAAQLARQRTCVGTACP